MNADRFADELAELVERARANRRERDAEAERYSPIPRSPVYDTFTREMGYEK